VQQDTENKIRELEGNIHPSTTKCNRNIITTLLLSRRAGFRTGPYWFARDDAFYMSQLVGTTLLLILKILGNESVFKHEQERILFNNRKIIATIIIISLFVCDSRLYHNTL
jgi:hypothetical protein